jgi:hypothetical protein
MSSNVSLGARGLYLSPRNSWASDAAGKAVPDEVVVSSFLCLLNRSAAKNNAARLSAGIVNAAIRPPTKVGKGTSLIHPHIPAIMPMMSGRITVHSKMIRVNQRSNQRSICSIRFHKDKVSAAFET